MTRPARSKVARDAPLLERDEVRLIGKAGIVRDFPWLAPKMRADPVHKRHERAVVSRVGHKPVRDDHLMRRVDRDLAVVALYEAVASGQDPAVGGSEVALRSAGRSTVFAAQWLPLPTHARQGARPALVLAIGRISRLRVQRGLGGADRFQPPLLVGHPVRRLVTPAAGTVSLILRCVSLVRALQPSVYFSGQG